MSECMSLQPIDAIMHTMDAKLLPCSTFHHENPAQLEQKQLYKLNSHESNSRCNTGWHRINRTIQPFNRVYEKLHKIMPLVLAQPTPKVDSSYSCDLVLNQGLPPDIQKLSGNNFTSQQHCAPLL